MSRRGGVSDRTWQSGITVSDATAQMFDPDDPHTPVKTFLQEYQALFGFGPEALDDANVQRDPSSFDFDVARSRKL